MKRRNQNMRESARIGQDLRFKIKEYCVYLIVTGKAKKPDPTGKSLTTSGQF